MKSIKEFQTSQIRSVWNDEEQQWYFSVVDVVGALSEASNAKRYWSDLKRKLKSEGANETYEKIVRLKLKPVTAKCALLTLRYRKHTAYYPIDTLTQSRTV